MTVASFHQGKSHQNIVIDHCTEFFGSNKLNISASQARLLQLSIIF